MLALRNADGPSLANIDPPTLGANEALIRVRRAGICTTDLEIVKGYMGFEGTLGHELVGEVLEVNDAEVNDAEESWVGVRVTGEINLGCGTCERCVRGMSRHCATRTVLGILNKDGCMAEYVTPPVANLHRVPDEVPDVLAAFTEPLAAAFEILEQVRIEPSARCAVLGDGKLGSLVAMVLRQTGAAITVVGKYPEKLAALGIETTTLHDEMPKDCDFVVEATGSAEGFERARSMLRPRGTLIQLACH